MDIHLCHEQGGEHPGKIGWALGEFDNHQFAHAVRDVVLAENLLGAIRVAHDHATDGGLRGLGNTERKDDEKIVGEGVNLVKKHTKPNPMKGTTGGIVEKTMPIHQSNVAIFNPATGKADRVGIKVEGDKRVRVFKSSGEEIKVA